MSSMSPASSQRFGLLTPPSHPSTVVLAAAKAMFLAASSLAQSGARNLLTSSTSSPLVEAPLPDELLGSRYISLFLYRRARCFPSIRSLQNPSFVFESNRTEYRGARALGSIPRINSVRWTSGISTLFFLPIRLFSFSQRDGTFAYFASSSSNLPSKQRL